MSAFDPYLIPGSSVLQNRIGLTSSRELARAEADLVTARILQLMDDDVIQWPSTGDWAELSAIHRHLFQDVYEWAGEIRTIDMRRGDGHLFAPQVGIKGNLEQFGRLLAETDFLNIDGRALFIEQITELYDLLNWIHPFREGNGRAQRHFWSRIASDAGWLLDWRRAGVELAEASRCAREENDFSMLYVVFDNIVAPHRWEVFPS